MRSAVAIVAVTAVFAGTLVGGLHRAGALDPEMLRGPKEDHPGAARAGWRTHTVPEAGFSIQLPPDWSGAPAGRKTVFRVMKGKKVVVATLTVGRSQGDLRESESVTTKRFRRGGHTVTFRTSERFAAAYKRVFEQAADSYRAT